MMHTVQLEDVPCPLGCGRDDAFVVHGHDRLNHVPGEFTVVRCRSCGLMRTTPRPTPSSISAYYPDTYSPYLTTRVTAAPTAGAGVARRSAIGRLARAAIGPRTRPLPDLPPGRMLEVGCGSGSFLHSMAARGWDVEGIEYSSTAAAQARALGYRVHTGSLEAAPDPSRPYDLIVGWMVLEHLHDPVAGLRKLRRWSSPASRLVLSVPDAGALDRRLFADAWYALSLPTHLFHYTPRTLRLMLRRAGWTADRLHWEHNPNYMLNSLRYRCLDRGRPRAAAYLADVAQGRRHGSLRLAMGKLLGLTRQSGRMTVWASPSS